MTKITALRWACRRQFCRTMFICIPILLASLAVDASEEPRNRPQSAPAGEEEATEPDAAVVPFLGTWLQEETIVLKQSSATYRVQRYLLIRWHKNDMLVKTLVYLPDQGTQNHVSDWYGTIPIDKWNQWKQTFAIMPDGTISVGLSGTDGFGPRAVNYGWWASGSLVLLEDDETGARLRFYTDRGYAPSSKGNAWKPLDRIYHLVSREIDPKYILRRKY
ncbi:MAG: hypothetical protein O7D35_09885 [Acidobacteria bacterium]|nr:hypothetical protein [Acidobacteriota bacterium]